MAERIFFTFMCYVLIVAHHMQVSSALEVKKSGEVKGKATEEEAQEYIRELDLRYSSECNLEKEARWRYVTNITSETEQEASAAAIRFDNFKTQIQLEILESFSEWREYQDSRVRREFQYYSIQGRATMVAQDYQTMNSIRVRMEQAYSSARVCEYENDNNCNLAYADIANKLNTVTDYDELAYYWTAWHDAVSNNISPEDYTTFIAFQNQMARLNYFNDMGEMWLANFNDGTDSWSTRDFKRDILAQWSDLQRYYNIIHAYLRYKLRAQPQFADKIEPTGSIPANLVKNMWSQDWTALYSTTKPYMNASSIMETGTEALLAAGYSVLDIFKASDEFYTQLGMLPMTESFWNKTLYLRPENREVSCVPPFEWDMCLGKGSDDVRIKLCGEVDMDYLSIIHHEMGHMQYFLQYINEDYIFRDGANPGFHEGIGNSVPLAITTPKHMECALGLDLGLGVDCAPSEPWMGQPVTPGDINYLYLMALEKFPFYALTMSMEAWRWEAFEEKIPEKDYNKRWWELKQSFQGVIPPTSRSNSEGFDPGSKSQIVSNSAYFRYYISYILQFQFYETMCRMAGEYNPNIPNSKPLYQCDFSGNAEVGRAFGDMLKSGFSKPWPQVLQNFTSFPSVSIQPVVNFFKPLFYNILEELEAAGELPCFDEHCSSYV